MTEIEFKMDGPIFDHGSPIHLVAKVLTEVQIIFDKTYLELERTNRITKKDRQRYLIRSTEFRKGSFVSDFQIVYDAANMVLPTVAVVSSDTLWEYTKNAWELIKLVHSNFKETKEPPQYQPNNNGTATLIQGDFKQVFNGPVINIAKEALPHYRELTDLLVNEPGLDRIHLGDPDIPEIVLESNNSELLNYETITNGEPVIVVCDVFDFNKVKKVGKLTAKSESDIPAGNYRFEVVGQRGSEADYIYSMLKSEVKLRCLREELVKPMGINKISCLHVIEIIYD